MTEEAFLSACVAEPGEPAHRLALADWLMERDDPRVRWVRDAEVFPWTLPDLTDPVPRLIEALGEEDEAESVLLKLGAEAVPALLIADMRREPGAEGLLRRMRTPEVERLMGQFGWGEEADDVPVLEALTRIGEPAAVLVPHLISSMVRADEATEAAFVRFLEALGRATPAALRVAWQYAFLSEESLGPLLCEAAIRLGPHPLILDALIIWNREEGSAEGRALAALAAQSPTVLESLIAHLHGEEFAPHAILGALAALGRNASPALPSILPLLWNEDETTIRAAAYALGRIGPAAKEAVPRLRELAAHDCPARPEAAEALERITGKA